MAQPRHHHGAGPAFASTRARLVRRRNRPSPPSATCSSGQQLRYVQRNRQGAHRRLHLRCRLWASPARNRTAATPTRRCCSTTSATDPRCRDRSCAALARELDSPGFAGDILVEIAGARRTGVHLSRHLGRPARHPQHRAASCLADAPHPRSPGEDQPHRRSSNWLALRPVRRGHLGLRAGCRRAAARPCDCMSAAAIRKAEHLLLDTDMPL